MAIEVHDEIARQQASVSRRTVVGIVLERNDQDTSLNRQLIVTNDPPRYRHVLTGEANVAPTYFSVSNQSTRDELCSVDRRCKADPLSRKDCRGINADDLPASVYQWSARVARIQRCIGLNNSVHEAPGLCTQGATECANNSRCDRILKTVGVADCDHQLTDTNQMRVTKTGRNQVRRVDADHREVGIRIVTDELCLESPSIHESHIDLACAMDDVAIGKNESVGRKDKSGPTACRFALRLSATCACRSNLDVDD